MVTEKQLETKVKSLKNLIVKPLLVEADGKVAAFVVLYGKVGIGNRMSAGLMEVNQLWDQSGSKRPKGYVVAGNLFDNDGHTGASCFVAEEYLGQRHAHWNDWAAQARTFA